MDVEGHSAEKKILKKDLEEPAVAEGDSASKTSSRDSVRIMIDIRMTNGMQIRQKNLSFGHLRKLVEKLEGLC